MSEVIVRPTSADDLDAIADIYAHHVRTGVATFEVDPPDAREWRRRFSAVTDAGLPFISAAMDDGIAGYAYWRTRSMSRPMPSAVASAAAFSMLC
jgi:L-amino acid N-acyltransferase YncA